MAVVYFQVPHHDARLHRYLRRFTVVPIEHDPTTGIIARVAGARKRLDGAPEGSAAYRSAERQLDRAQAALLRNTPTTDAGMLALIDHAHQEGYDADDVLMVLERALRRRRE
jgi:hypothetical protein